MMAENFQQFLFEFDYKKFKLIRPKCSIYSKPSILTVNSSFYCVVVAGVFAMLNPYQYNIRPILDKDL